MQIKKENLVKIANKKAEELGYNLSSLKIVVDENNELWHQYISSGPILESNQSLKNQLGDRDFYTIYYSPKISQKGGDLWIFVDKKNSEIITFIKGK